MVERTRWRARGINARSAVAIGDAYVTDDAVVPRGALVAIIPPVIGG
jgi:molybdopterin converting factor small subunit